MKKYKKVRSKRYQKPQGRENGKGRQEMLGADWMASAESPDGSLAQAQGRPEHDVDHQPNGRHVYRSEDELVDPRKGRKAIDLGEQNYPEVVPQDRKVKWGESLPRGRFASIKRASAVRPDGASNDEDLGCLQSNIYGPVHQGLSLLVPEQSSLGDSGIHPDRAHLLNQSWREEGKRDLKTNRNLSTGTGSILLERGLSQALSGSQQDPVVITRPATPPPPTGARLNPFKANSIFKSPRTSKNSVRTVSETPTEDEMSPGILIPRNAGIKLRGVEQEPPLVSAPAPDKSKIVVASQYLFQHDLEAAGMMDERDVQGRLQGIQVIEAGRRGLRMPMKTYGTACVFFMRYRYHVATKGAEDDAASRYDFRDAALASLWLASKAEETPKKSKEILCAFRNSTLALEDHLTPDDEVFENQAKLMINLERYLLEIVAFDFRARNCGELLAGLMVDLGTAEKVVRIAMAVTLDIYRTLAVLKQTRQTLALSCLEMAARFVQAEGDISKVTDEALYARLGTSRQEVLETLFDLIELYLNHHVITAAGSKYNINDFMRVSTTLRSEMKAKGYTRYTYIQELPPSTSPTTSPVHTDAKSTPTLLGTPRTPANRDTDRRDSTKKRPSPKENEKILVDERDIEIGKPVSPPPQFLLSSPGRLANGHGTSSPTSPTSPSVEAPNPDDPSQVKEVVRFVLDASRARDEDLLRRPFHQIETVEVTELKDLWIPKDGSAEQSEFELAAMSPASPPPHAHAHAHAHATGVGKMRNGDVDMRDMPPSAAGSGPYGPRGMRDPPPMGPRGDRDRDRDRDRERDDRRDRDRERDRRRSPPPPSRMYGRDDRYGRRDDRRW